MDAEQVFITESVRFARTLPLRESVEYLRGFCLSCKDGEAVEFVRKIVTALSDSDSQLELIQSGQLKLRLQ